MTLIKFKSDSPVRMPYWSEFFNDLFESRGFAPDVRKGTVPPVNVVENDNQYRLELAAPGLMKEDFKISVENEMLTVSGEHKSETTKKDELFTRKEFSFSSFTRSFTLPEHVDTEHISATYENGIMKLVLPKKEEAKAKQPREIAVV